MLKEIIGKGYYSFEQHFDDWQEAIRAGYRTLLEAGVVEDIYVAGELFSCVHQIRSLYRYRTGCRPCRIPQKGQRGADGTCRSSCTSAESLWIYSIPD